MGRSASKLVKSVVPVQSTGTSHSTRWPSGWSATAAIVAAGMLLAPEAADAAVMTSYGVQAQLWTPVNGGMKMDYDWVRNRFVIQHPYPSWPPSYGVIDLNTKVLSHLASTSGVSNETLLTVLPSTWGPYAQGTTLVPRGGGGEIHAIDPNGIVSTFTTGLPGGGAGPTNYSTVRWDEFGAAGNDLLYANEGTGHVLRINSAGTPVWSSLVRRPDSMPSRPEAVIALGSNPRWGAYQNSILVGENDVTTNVFQLDPVTGLASLAAPPLGQVIGRTPESFRVYPFSGGNVALYLSLFNGVGSSIWQLTNLSAIPNLQPGDLFVAVEHVNGGEVWHVYFDSNNVLVTQQVATVSGDGYLEDMVFAPVPEPGSIALLLVAAAPLTLRRTVRTC